MYYFVAIILSGAWLSAYFVSPLDEMIEEAFRFDRVLQYSLFPIMSVIIATTFRKWILACRGWKALLPSSILPWFGTLMVALATAFFGYFSTESQNSNILASLFVSLWYGVVYTVMGFWVIFPLGIFSQYALLAVGGDSTQTGTGRTMRRC
ncbi:hypothetical protein [Roseibacillus persicicus]|uniref:hypothetical protein n=1 Tax=Roseibacillus persicicus TaxID=454148 RepID=UPI00280E3867|nr:hypothetical protein [Roseibacillus persicicus]MDQ8192632.1 hypothetical protein [Roseibacillus persicicus]